MKTKITPEEILASHSRPVQALAEKLRRLVREAVPEAEERAYPHWHAIGYRHPRAGYFCGLFPFQDKVHLLFEWGLLLPDPEGLLQGEGKQVRYIPIFEEADISPGAFQALIRAALQLPDSRAVKLELIRAKSGSGG